MYGKDGTVFCSSSLGLVCIQVVWNPCVSSASEKAVLVVKRVL